MNVIYGLHLGDRRFRYVGLTTVGITRRLRAHKTSARSGVRLPVYDWMRKYDCEVLIDIIEEVPDRENLDAREIFWIAFYRGTQYRLLNVADGGESAGLKLGRGWNKGLKHPATSIANLGKPKPPTQRKAISKAMKAHTRTETHVQNLVESRKGVLSPGNHVRWHTNKGISKPETCKFCKEEKDTNDS